MSKQPLTKTLFLVILKSQVSTGREWCHRDFFFGITLIMGRDILNPARPPAIKKFFPVRTGCFANRRALQHLPVA
jgi:hypothetical protein